MVTLNEMLENCVVEEQPNGLHTVWMENNPKRGQIADCEGSKRFEIIENAYQYLKALEFEMGTDF